MATNWSEQVQKAAQGDKNAYAELYKATYRKTSFLADKILQNEQDAQKVIEKSYAEAFSDLKKLGNPDFFDSWIVNITAKNCCNHIREKNSSFSKNDYPHISEIEDNMEFLPGGLLGSEKAVTFVSKLVDSMPEYQRTAVVLCYSNNLPASNIAHMLSLTEEDVKAMLYSARERIKSETDARLPKATKLYSSDKAPVLGEVFSISLRQKAVKPELFRESFKNIVEAPAQTKPKAPAPVSAAPIPVHKEKPTEPKPSKNTTKKKSPVIKIVAIVTAVAIVIAGLVGGGLGLGAIFTKDDMPHTETAPDGFIPLYTAEDLELIRSDLSASYILMDDIDMSSVDNWVPIAADAEALDEGFNGVFDGNGYTIKNLKSKGHFSGGLFGYVCDGTVMNLYMEKVDIEAEAFAGGVAGSVYGIKSGSKANISNCHVVSGKIISRDTAGGIAGNLMTFENEETNPVCISKYCSNGASVSGSYVGGIAGYAGVGNCGTVIASNNLNYGEISGEFYSGGLFGEIENDEGKVTISDSVSVGKVVAHTSDNSNASTGLIAATIDADNDFSVELVNCIYTVVDGLDPYKLGAALIKDETIGVSEKDAKKKSTYEVLDFDTIWEWDSKNKMPVIKKFLANDNSGIISGTPDASTTESTTLVSAENLTASSSDFELLLKLVDNTIRNTEKDYNYTSSNAYDVMEEILFNVPLSFTVYSIYFDDYAEVYENDPLGKFEDNVSFCKYPEENMDWIISNVFNLAPDHSINTDEYYYYNGFYYVVTYGIGDYYRDLYIESQTKNPDGTYTLLIKCDISDIGDEGVYLTEYYTVKAALREDNGKKYWSLYSMSKGESVSVETTDTWREAYNEYLYSYYDEIISDEYNRSDIMSFGFAYITDDDIPELLISEGDFVAAQVRVVTFSNNAVHELGDFGFMGELPYVERGSIILDGYYHHGIDSGTYLEITDSGSTREIFSYYTNAAAVADENEIVYEINDVEVSKEEFDSACETNQPENIQSFTNSDGYIFNPNNFDTFC